MPRFTSQPMPAGVRVGDSQVMPCEVNPDLVPFTRWEKDRQPLELGARLVQLPGGALVVSNASEADAGLYRCLVENVGPAKSSDEALLQILPGNTLHPNSQGDYLLHLVSNLFFHLFLSCTKRCTRTRGLTGHYKTD